MRVREKIDFLNSVPIEQKQISKLFDFLDKKLEESECSNDITLTKEFFESVKILLTDEIINWFQKNGGYCDCEILANVEDSFLRYGIDI